MSTILMSTDLNMDCISIFQPCLVWSSLHRPRSSIVGSQSEMSINLGYEFPRSSGFIRGEWTKPIVLTPPSTNWPLYPLRGAFDVACSFKSSKIETLSRILFVFYDQTVVLYIGWILANSGQLSKVPNHKDSNHDFQYIIYMGHRSQGTHFWVIFTRRYSTDIFSCQILRVFFYHIMTFFHPVQAGPGIFKLFEVHLYKKTPPFQAWNRAL